MSEETAKYGTQDRRMPDSQKKEYSMKTMHSVDVYSDYTETRINHLIRDQISQVIAAMPMETLERIFNIDILDPSDPHMEKKILKAESLSEDMKTHMFHRLKYLKEQNTVEINISYADR